MPKPDDQLSVAAVLLAAGAGSRLGGRAKSLLEIDGVPLIQRLLAAFSGAGISEIVVVLGHYSDQITPVLANFPVELVINPNPQAGLISSQRHGLAGLAGRADAVLMALADQPLITADDISELLAFWKTKRQVADVVFPKVNGQRGNPVVLSASAREQILAGDDELGCRAWQQAHPTRTIPFVSANEHYRVDLDTEADVAQLQRESGLSLRWPAS